MNKGIIELSIDSVIPYPNQPRKYFDESKIKELAESIKIQGLLQPILVRPIQNGKFQLVHGERRWRACKLVGLETIKAEIRELSDKEALEIQLVENLQREDLNPIEEAEIFKRMIDSFGYTHEELAKRIGKSREYVSNKLRLLKLPDEVQEKMRMGFLKERHARALLSFPEVERQKEIATKIVEEGLSVRETEQLLRNSKNVSRVTLSFEMDRMLLIPIPSKIYGILTNFAKTIKCKPEDLIVKAILAFIKRKEEVKP